MKITVGKGHTLITSMSPSDQNFYIIRAQSMLPFTGIGIPTMPEVIEIPSSPEVIDITSSPEVMDDEVIDIPSSPEGLDDEVIDIPSTHEMIDDEVSSSEMLYPEVNTSLHEDITTLPINMIGGGSTTDEECPYIETDLNGSHVN